MFFLLRLIFLFFFFFFFFQAEDGIRDTSVTGVQTCALPISMPPTPEAQKKLMASNMPKAAALALVFGLLLACSYQRLKGGLWVQGGRSEERRVGKECRARWAAYH